MNIIKSFRGCPCCANKKCEKIADLNFSNINDSFLPKHYDIVSCIECGFTYANSEANQDVYTKYYSNFNIYSEDNVIKKIESVDSSHNIVYKYIKKKFSKEKRIIDIGCGDGAILSLLKHDGYNNLVGLDPSQSSIEILTSNGIKAIKGNLFDEVSDEHRRKYDIVLSTCVIEHVFDLNTYINRLIEYLNTDDKAAVILMLPDAEGFTEWIAPKPNYFNQEHINFFSINSLDNLMKMHGLIRIIPHISFYFNRDKYILAEYKVGKETYTIKKDFTCKESIEKYLEMYNEQQSEVINKICKIEQSKKPVIVFGAGQLAMQIFADRKELFEKVLFFVDNNSEKHNKLLENKLIKQPSEVKNNPEAVVMVCSMFNGEDIKKQLEDMDISNEIVVI